MVKLAKAGDFMEKSSRLLINEEPLQLLPGLAVAIGLNEAIVIQQVHYWLKNNQKNGINYHDGRYWTYNSIEKWQSDNFPFWSVMTVRRIFNALEAKRLLISNNFNKAVFDRTKWYTIDYSALVQFEQIDSDRMNEPIPEIKPYANKQRKNKVKGSLTRLASKQAQALEKHGIIHKVEGLNSEEVELQHKIKRYYGGPNRWSAP